MPIETIDLLGHLFYLSLFLGNVMISRKNKIGWLFRLGGEAGWLSLGILLGLTSIVFWSIPFIYVDIKGYLLWKKSQK